VSLTTRLALGLVALGVPALLAVLILNAFSLRDSTRALWAERHQLTAVAIAADLTQLSKAAAQAGSDVAEARQKFAQQRFARGDLTVLSVFDAERGAVFEGRRPAAQTVVSADGSTATLESEVPEWFHELIVPEPPSATVPLGLATGPGTVARVVAAADGSDLQRLAWSSFMRQALILLVAYAVLLGAVAYVLVRWHRPLKATVRQARALEQGQFVEAEEPHWPELRELTRSMNAVVRRLREQLTTQAEQVARLQQQAQTDGVTGLPLRVHFVQRLAQLLADSHAPAASLLLVRVPELAQLNERHGRDEADRLLAAVADVLATYAERIKGAIAGRLSGQDFALYLPAAGAARETAAAIQAALAAAPAARLAGARFVLAGCDGLRGISTGAALSAADTALARAEANSDTVVEDLPELGATSARAWREQLTAALEQSRVRLGAFPVLDPQQRLIHLECPLRVQLEPDGEFLVARRWLALAARSKLMPIVDQAALNLGLAAIAEDGQARCVHVSPRSLTSPGFGRTLLARLKAAGAHAQRLSIEWTEMPDAAATAALREAVPAWRRLGVRVGVEHAGASPRDLPSLKEIGIDYVKVDARHLHGVTEDAAVRSYAESLVALIHGLGLHAIAEGVGDARHLELLWTLGFDGATGPAVVWPAPAGATVEEPASAVRVIEATAAPAATRPEQTEPR
jgi:EAL domain-containing protein (putative c-di-GMP-specific phosphodiesterase class I)/GGDEF domain-containing protein